MDMYKLKFTKLQEEILRFLFIKSGMTFNARKLAISLDVSPTAIAKSLKALEKESLIVVKKDRDSNHLSVGLNRETPFVFSLKRSENLKMIYESGIDSYLSEKFPGAVIILFGSYSFGEDVINSDIDIAVIGAKEREIDLGKFSRLLERKISLHFFDSFSQIHKNLRENIFNGIVIKGGVRL